MSTRPLLYGPDGEPLLASRGPITASEQKDAAVVKGLYDTVNSYLSALGLVSAPAIARASEPLANHVWVFAAAMVISVTASSAPFVIMRETDGTTRKRRDMELRSGRKWYGPKAGLNRRSAERYINVPVQKRLNQAKALEPDYEHPAYNLLRRPNPIQSHQQFMQFTVLWLATRGEVFWVYGDDEGLPVERSRATQVWPYGPDFFRPIYSSGQYGKLIGWRFTLPNFSPIAEKTGPNVSIDIPLEVVSQFKFANPLNPVRGMSRLTAAAMSIESSLLTKGHTRALLKNQAVTRGRIVHDTTLDPKEEEEFLTKWNQKFMGPSNTGRTGMLNAGFKYQPIALTPDEMQFLGSEEMSRLEVLAAMGTPPGLLGITDTTNYATMQVQESGFWSRNILPTYHVIENEVDSTLLYQETDNVVGLFDVSGIDALRIGISDKITMAEKMSNTVLHVPPRVAFEVVGLEVPEYEGEDKCLVSGMLSTVDEIINPPVEAPAAAPSDPNSQPTDGTSSDNSKAAGVSTKSRVDLESKGRKRHREFNSVVRKYMAGVKTGYRSWVSIERSKVLYRFDRHAKSEVNIDAIVGDIINSQQALKNKTMSARRRAMLAAGKFTEGDIESIAGVPVIDLGSDRYARYFARRTEAFSHDVAASLNKKLRHTLIQGIQDGDTVQELRARVASAFDIAAGSSKALVVARTETANLMNGIRDEIFDEAGIQEEEWVNSGDEAVRDSHKTFGESGPQKRGFN